MHVPLEAGVVMHITERFLVAAYATTHKSGDASLFYHTTCCVAQNQPNCGFITRG
jgi:hypothetical protein